MISTEHQNAAHLPVNAIASSGTRARAPPCVMNDTAQFPGASQIRAAHTSTTWSVSAGRKAFFR
jgi:hypothetical protein